MHKAMARIGVLLCASICACAETAPLSNQPPSDLYAPVERFTLDNGFEVLVQSNRTVPIVTAVVVVRAGSFYEDEETNGYAHLFEHMIFKGSAEVPDDLLFREQLDATGAAHNAATYVDWVRYYVTATRDEIDTAVGLMAGALREPLLDSSALDKEIQVVLDEFDLRTSSHSWRQRHAMLEGLFGDGLTRLDALGSRKAVRQATAASLRREHASRYQPSNAALVLTGDIDRAEARRIAKRHFGDWPPRNAPAEAPTLELVPLTNSTGRVLELPATESTLLLGFRLPGHDEEPELAAHVALLDRVTLQTDHPFRNLVGPGEALGADLSFEIFRGAGYLYASVSVPFGEERRILARLRAQMDALGSRGNVTSAQFAQALDEAWIEAFEAQNDPYTAAFTLGSAWVREDVGSADNLTEAIYTTSLGRMRGFARRYVTGKPAVAVLLTSPKNARRHSLDQRALEELL